MPTILLTQGQRARVDWRDYKRLTATNWYAIWAPSTKSFYAAGHTSTAGGAPRRTLQMARVILGLQRGDKLQADHINHDTLDNRRRNLRPATVREQAENRRNGSQYGIGVYRSISLKNPFQLIINEQHVGMFATAEEAREARRQLVI